MDSLNVKKWHLNAFSLREREQANARQMHANAEREYRREQERQRVIHGEVEAAPKPVPFQPGVQRWVNDYMRKFAPPVRAKRTRTTARGR